MRIKYYTTSHAWLLLTLQLCWTLCVCAGCRVQFLMNDVFSDFAELKRSNYAAGRRSGWQLCEISRQGSLSVPCICSKHLVFETHCERIRVCVHLWERASDPALHLVLLMAAFLRYQIKNLLPYMTDENVAQTKAGGRIKSELSWHLLWFGARSWGNTHTHTRAGALQMCDDNT